MIINSVLIFTSIILSGIILIIADWRWKMTGLAVIQLICFIQIIQIWPIALASVKLISGWMGIALMSATMASSGNQEVHEMKISARVFRLMQVAFSWIVISASIERLNSWLPIPYTNLFIGLVFFFCGILFFSSEHEISGIAIGLLIFLSGFDLIYSSLEGSALVTGIYGVIIILISIISSYLQGGLSEGGSS
jgi:hypothetical protein